MRRISRQLRIWSTYSGNALEYGGGPQTPASTLGGSLAQNITKEIVLNLNALVQAGVLNSVIEIDYGKAPLTIEPQAGYPFALVGMPVVNSDYEDQARIAACTASMS